MENKKQIIAKFLLALGLTLALSVPAMALAQSSVDQGLNQVGGQAGFPTGGLAGLTNQGPVGFIANIIDILLIVAGAVAVLFVIIGGFWIITAQGSEDQAKKGRRTVVNAIVGIVIIILSYVIINVIVSFVTRT